MVQEYVAGAVGAANFTLSGIITTSMTTAVITPMGIATALMDVVMQGWAESVVMASAVE